MKTFIKKVRYFAMALALALAVQPVASVTAVSDAKADVRISNELIVSGSSLNPWPVILIGTGVASIIACAMIVGEATGEELTLEQAVHAGLFPLHCLFDGSLHE
jgi:hypothetical protein